MTEYTQPELTWTDITRWRGTEALEFKRGCLVRTLANGNASMVFVPGVALEDFGLERVENEPETPQISFDDDPKDCAPVGHEMFDTHGAPLFTLSVDGAETTYYGPPQPADLAQIIEHLNTQTETGPIERFYEHNGAIAYDWVKIKIEPPTLEVAPPTEISDEPTQVSLTEYIARAGSFAWRGCWYFMDLDEEGQEAQVKPVGQAPTRAEVPKPTEECVAKIIRAELNWCAEEFTAEDITCEYSDGTWTYSW